MIEWKKVGYKVTIQKGKIVKIKPYGWNQPSKRKGGEPDGRVNESKSGIRARGGWNGGRASLVSRTLLDSKRIPSTGRC